MHRQAPTLNFTVNTTTTTTTTNTTTTTVLLYYYYYTPSVLLFPITPRDF